MKKLWVIARKDIREAFRSRSTYVFIVIMLVVTISYVANYNNHVKALTNSQAIYDYSRIFLNYLAYFFPLMYSIILCTVLANYSVVLDKAKRNIESLMATPISIRQIWMGKSLAVAFPSLVIGISVSIVFYLVMNFAFVIPKTNSFVFPDAIAVVSALIIVPVLIFSIVAIVVYIQLTIVNPRVASFVFTGIFIGLFLGVNALGAQGTSTDIFPLIYLGIIGLCAGISAILSRRLTKEKVLLSSKA
jgi:ABC-2 type transport system permease protein